MTELLVAFINLLADGINNFIPVYDIPQGTYNTVFGSINSVIAFLTRANFIVPLPDIALILSADISVRIFKLALFGGNWIIRRIADIIP